MKIQLNTQVGNQEGILDIRAVAVAEKNRTETEMDKTQPKLLRHNHLTRSARYIPAFYFSFLTPFYDFLMRFGARESAFKPELVKQVRIRSSHRVLDIGCGTGTLTIMLKKAQPQAEVIGLDGDPEVLKIAKTKNAKAKLDIPLDFGMSYELPYPDGSFDRVTASMVLHHLTIENKTRTLREAFRVLKPEGELHVIDFGKPQNKLMRLPSLITRHLEETADLINGSLPRLLRETGFEHVEPTSRFMTVFGTFAMYKAQKTAHSSGKTNHLEGENKSAATENQNHKARVEKEKYYLLLKTYARIIAPFYNMILRSLTFGFDLELRHAVIDYANAPIGSKILDVATGTGKQAFAFAEKGYDVVGIDLSRDMLKIAKKDNRYENVKLDLADATNLPFEDDSFRVSCVSFALHDMIPAIREKALKEMVRVTKPNGTIMIIDYALPKNKIRRFFFYNFIKLYEPYYKEFIKSNLEKLLNKSSIQIEKEISILFGAGRIIKGTKAGGD